MIFYINLFLLTVVGIYYIYNNVVFQKTHTSTASYSGQSFNRTTELYTPIIDYLIKIKIYISIYINNLIYGPINNKFKLIKCELYSDISTKYDVTKYFLYNVDNKIDKALIEKIYSNNSIIFIDNEHIRLKITFSFNNQIYILYYSYNINESLRPLLNTDNYYYIPYPPYDEAIIENYRKNIVVPTYLDFYKKIGIYNLFSIESKNIENVMINNENNKKVYDYIEMVKTPFNDFGILYDMPVKLLWILVENEIDITSFNNFYLKYLLPILDEDKMELVEHSIKLENINNIIISKRMKDILKIN